MASHAVCLLNGSYVIYALTTERGHAPDGQVLNMACCCRHNAHPTVPITAPCCKGGQLLLIPRNLTMTSLFCSTRPQPSCLLWRASASEQICSAGVSGNVRCCPSCTRGGPAAAFGGPKQGVNVQPVRLRLPRHLAVHHAVFAD